MPETLCVEHIMTTSVVSVDMDCTVAEVGRVFKAQGFHHLVVVEKGRLFGVISDRDFLRTVSPFAGTDAARECDAFTLRRPVHQIMSRQPRFCEPGTPVRDAAHEMLEAGIGCLPVVDSERMCVGLITLRDIAKWALNRLDADEASETGANAA